MTSDPGSAADSSWIEDPELALAVAEVEEFAAAAGWDRPPQLFALVRTMDLLSAEPGLADSVHAGSPFTPIAQDELPESDLSQALARIAWPPEVAGCVLTQEIVVMPPDSPPPTGGVADRLDPGRREGRLVAGVLRGAPGGACLLRMRDDPDTPLRGGDLAPGLLRVLRETLLD